MELPGQGMSVMPAPADRLPADASDADVVRMVRSTLTAEGYDAEGRRYRPSTAIWSAALRPCDREQEE